MAFYVPTNLSDPILNTALRDAGIVLGDIEREGVEAVERRYKSEKRAEPAERGRARRHLAILEAARAAEKVFRVEFASTRELRPEAYPALYRIADGSSGRGVKELAQAASLVKPIVLAHEASLRKLCALSPGAPHWPPAFRGVDAHLPAATCYTRLIEEYARLRADGKRDPVTIRVEEATAVVSSGICFLQVRSVEAVVFRCTYEQLLCLKDVTNARVNALIASAILYPNDPLMPALAEKSFLWQEQCLSRYGNAGFEIAKATEALSKAYLSRIGRDVLSGPGDSFDLMLEKTREKERKIRRSGGAGDEPEEYLADVYAGTVLKPCTSILHVAELFGLQKFIGHPTIDPAKSATKAREEAQSLESVFQSDIVAHRRVFCDQFTRAFIAKHGRYPKLTFPPGRTALKELYLDQVLAFSRSAYLLEDWDGVRFGKELEFEEYDDYLELISDKAISLPRSEKARTWDFGPGQYEKRLLLELLRRPTFSVKSVLDVVETGVIPREWLICSLYPKEREFKLEARLFCMMTLEMRTFFTAHEANLAHNVLPYFPQITMTDSRLKVHKRFMSMTTPPGGAEFRKVFIEVDLSSWNLRWRKATVQPVGRDLNDLFGLKHAYTIGHEFFERALMMIRVQGWRPDGIELDDPPEQGLCWTNHRGGLEGIMQKLWSIVTELCVERALSPMDVKFSITIQGDNVVVVITYRRDPTVSEKSQAERVAAEALRRLEAEFALVHQVTKPEECLVSTTVLTYSKVVYINGADYPLNLKLASRIHPTSSTDFPSVGAYVQSIFSGAYGVAAGCKRPESCYWYALVQAGRFLLQSQRGVGIYGPALRSATDLRGDFALRSILLRPSELGGLPVIGPYRFLYEGGGDPLSASLASLVMLQDYLPEARSIIASSYDDRLFAPSPRLSSLLSDPYGIPILRPRTCETVVEEETLAVLSEHVANVEIGDAIRFASQDYEDRLMEVVGTLRPFNPVVARDLVDASALGTVKSIKKAFLATSTIQSLTRQSNGESIQAQLVRAACEEISFMAFLARLSVGSSSHVSSLYRWVNTLRLRWSTTCPVIEGLTSYLPVDFPLSWSCSPDTVGVEAEFRREVPHPFYDRGKNESYLGTATVQKMSEHGYKIVGRGAALAALKTLQSIMSWGGSDGPLRDLVDYLSRSRCGQDLSPVAAYLGGVLGGNQGHRYQARIGERGAHVLGQSTFGSSVIVSSDNAGYLSGGLEDYKVMFQEFFLYAIALLSFSWDRNRDADFLRVVIEVGVEPLERLDMDSLTIRQFDPLPEVPLGMRLVQSFDTGFRRKSGPVWGTRLHLFRPSRKFLPLAALVSELRRSYRSQAAVMASLEHVRAHISLHFGLPEVLGCGAATLLDAVAIAAIDSIQSVIHSSRYLDRFSADLVMALRRVAAALCEAVLPFLSHPKMRDDPLVRHLDLTSTIRYFVSAVSGGAILSYVVNRAMRLVRDPDSVYYRLPVIIFGSEGGDATLSGFITLLRKRSLHARASRQIDFRDSQFIVGSTIRRMLKKKPETEEEAINFALRFASTYSVHRRGTDEKPPRWVLVSSMANAVALQVVAGAPGSELFATTESAEECVRRYRTRPQASQRPIRELKIPSECVDNQARSNDRSAVPLTPDWGVSPPLSLLDRAMYSFRAAVGRPYDLGSGAADMWLPLRHEFPGRHVRIVGSGLGAAAVSALIGGADSVVGLDLRRDMPPNVFIHSYLPPLVSRYGVHRRYQQSELSVMTSGDFFEPMVSKFFLSLADTTTAIIVDIPSERGRSPEVLTPLIVSRCRAELYIRVTGLKEEMCRLLGALASCGEVTAVWMGFCYGGIHEAVIRGRITRFVVPEMIEPQSPVGAVQIVRVPGNPSTTRILAMLVLPLGGLLVHTVRKTILGALRGFRMMLANDEARPPFAEWTQILHSVVVLEALAHRRASYYEDRLAELVESPVITLRTFPSITVRHSERLIYLYASIGSRLVGKQGLRL